LLKLPASKTGTGGVRAAWITAAAAMTVQFLAVSSQWL
jgi:hypothetical protein